MLHYLPLIGNQSDNGIQHGGELNGSGNKLRECFKDKSSFEYLIPPHDANKRASPVKPRCPIPAESRGGSGRARESGSMSAAVRYTSATRRILPRRCTFFFFFLLLLFCDTRDSVTVLKFSAFSLSPEAVQLGH